MMKRVSKFRRAGAWLLAAALAAPLLTYAEAGIQPLETIAAAAETFVTKQIPRQPAGTLRVSAGKLDPRLRLADCAVPLKASLPTGATFRPRMTVGVSCPGTPTWTVYVPVSVMSHTSVLVLKRAVPRGARLTAADVEAQPRDVSGTSDGYLTDVAELSGRTLKRPLGAGAALTIDALAEDPVVRRGQRVTLLASASGLEVRAAGLAMSDAPVAGRVKVQNLSSNRIVEGVVESADVIRITP